MRPQLRESAEHQADIPDRIGDPPAPSQDPPRWDPGPSFEEALASASGPEKAAADMLPLDATFDPDTHEGAGEPPLFQLLLCVMLYYIMLFDDVLCHDVLCCVVLCYIALRLDVLRRAVLCDTMLRGAVLLRCSAP